MSAFRLAVFLIFSIPCLPVVAQESWLGPAPVAPALPPNRSAARPENVERSALTSSPTWYDTSLKSNVRNLYNLNWVPSRTQTINWTGNTGQCQGGTISQNWINAAGKGLNFLRNLAGLNGTITMDPVTSAKNQKNAMLMSANNNISHTPPSTWTCYSAANAEAASNSNLCISSVPLAPGCLELYMSDFGSNNPDVGHRRWVLYPQTQQFGTGDVPVNSHQYAANSLWVFDGNYGTARPATRENFVAWPSPGYFPYELLPIRWSVSYPDADFAAATVSLTKNGTPVPVTLETVQNGYGENTLVWFPTGQNDSAVPAPVAPTSDDVYIVTVSHIGGAGVPSTISYTVTAFDPAASGSAVPAVTSAAPASGSGTSANFTVTFNDSDGYMDLDVVNVLINPFLDGRSSCYVAYSRPANTVYLVNDPGTDLLPGLTPGSGSVSNSYCTILGAGTSASGSGSILTLNLSIAFNQSTYAKDHVVYAAARDLSGGNSGWQAVGVWRVPSASDIANVSVLTPGSGTGSDQTFTLVFHDPAGAVAITNAQLLINHDLNGGNACYLGYVRGPNLLYLVNDGNTGLLAPVTPNSGTGSAQNSQCVLNSQGTTMSLSGNDLTLTIHVTFQSSFAGRLVLYAAFQDSNSLNTGWEARGVWQTP